MTTIERLLETDSVEELARLAPSVAGNLEGVLEQELPRALAGSPAAVTAYAEAWRTISRRLLAAAEAARPELVGEGWIADTDGIRSRLGSIALVEAMLEAPYSGLVGRFGAGVGSVVLLVLRLRELLPGSEVPAFTSAGIRAWNVTPEQYRRFQRLANQELARGDVDLVTRVRDLYDLTTPEVGRLFGVSRQAIDGWQRSGVPPDRLDKLETLVSVGEFLERKLRAGLLPAVARREAEAFGGLSLLELATTDHGRLRATIADAFDWSRTA